MFVSVGAGLCTTWEGECEGLRASEGEGPKASNFGWLARQRRRLLTHLRTPGFFTAVRMISSPG